MGDQQYGDALGGADAADQRGHRGLIGQIEAVQRLIEDQQPRMADQRLSDQQPLLLAAGKLGERATGVLAGPDERDHLIDPLQLGPSARARFAGQRDRQPPASAVESEADEVDPADPGRRVEAMTLREVADLGPRLGRRSLEHARGPRGEVHEPQDRLHQGRLARAVGSQDGQEFAPPDGQIHVADNDLTPEADPGAFEHDRRRFGLGHRGEGHRPVA